jgi:hypothetical protein
LFEDGGDWGHSVVFLFVIYDILVREVRFYKKGAKVV